MVPTASLGKGQPPGTTLTLLEGQSLSKSSISDVKTVFWRRVRARVRVRVREGWEGMEKGEGEG